MASRPQRKKQYLTQQASKQKELRQPNAEEHNDPIEAAVRKELRKQLPQIVQSASVQEQSVHIGPLPPADEARKYQELLPGFMDRTLALAEGLQKADIEITKRGQIFSSDAFLLRSFDSRRNCFCGAKKINERNNPQRKKREED